MRARRVLTLTAGAVAAVAIVATVRRRSSRGTSRSHANGVASAGFAARNVKLASVGARSGASYAVHRARRAIASESERERLDEAYQLRSATQVAEALGSMKGALMKIGQMASYLDDGMPEPVREALASLQQDAPPMHPSLCAEVVTRELGAPPEEVFAQWDPTPIAAASIGQVHRARTHDGVEVAVKVQYPGVDEAIRNDLVHTDLLFRVLGMAFPGLEPGPLVEEIRARLLEELDYGIEASNQRLFADYYGDHPYIHLPGVVDALSTTRVLTTEFAPGARFAEVEQWSQEQRNDAAETIFRFVFRSIYRLHAFNGDPHPGNYLFAPRGRVTFIDFGLVKRWTSAEVELFADLVQAIAAERDIPKFRRVLEQHNILHPAPDISDNDVFHYFAHFYDFVLEDRVVAIDSEYASESVRRIFDVNSPYAHVAKAANVPPVLVVSQRINLGLHAVLARLRPELNFRRIAEELWPWVDGPPSTAIGEAEHAWLRAHNLR